jgi:hypothetical protein
MVSARITPNALPRKVIVKDWAVFFGGFQRSMVPREDFKRSPGPWSRDFKSISGLNYEARR